MKVRLHTREFQLFLLVSCIILCLGAMLRIHQYTTWPRDGATFDEYAWTFLGMSLLETGIPTSWSPHKQYTMRSHFQNTRGANFFLVTPYLEHPPLFGLIAGASAKLRGVNDINDVTIDSIRLLAIGLGIVSLMLVIVLGYEIGGSIVGLCAGLCYAISPSVVIGSRLVQNENFFIPMFLASMYAGVRYVQKQQRIFLLISIVLAMLLPLAKIPFLAASAALALYFLSNKKYNETFLLVLGTVGSLGIYGLYSVLLDKELFLALMRLQTARYDMTFESFFSMFRNPMITDRYFLDGLVYLGFFACILVATLRKKEHIPVHAGFLSYFFIYLFVIPDEPGHGWYRYPLYPFLMLYIGIVIREFFNKNMMITAITLLIPGLAAFSTSWQQAFGFSYGIYRAFLLMSGFGILSEFLDDKRMLRLSRVISLILLCFVSVLVIWSTLGYTEQ